MRTTLLALALAACTPVAWAQGIAMLDEAGVRWACGGAGAEERAALDAPRSQANLELLFVTEKRGGYLADVRLTLHSTHAAQARLEVTADGPICVLFVPPGRYRIEASYGGITRTASIAAAASIGKPARTVIRFPEEPWDGVRATDEEKRQARE